MIFVSTQDSNWRYFTTCWGGVGPAQYPRAAAASRRSLLFATRGRPRATRHHRDVQAMSVGRRVPPAGAVTSGFGSKAAFRGMILIVWP